MTEESEAIDSGAEVADITDVGLTIAVESVISVMFVSPGLFGPIGWSVAELTSDTEPDIEVIATPEESVVAPAATAKHVPNSV